MDEAVRVAPRHLKWRRQLRRLARAALCVGLAYGMAMWFHARVRPLPKGISLEGPLHPVQDGEVELLADVTAGQGPSRIHEQEIFDRVLGLIQGAEEFIVADLFLFNSHLGQAATAHRSLAAEVSQALARQKQAHPNLRVVVISDPVNEAYGGGQSPHFAAMRAAGIPVVLTRLSALRDSNPLFSTGWRTFAQWFQPTPGGWLPHPFSPNAGKVGLGSWLSLLNFKANHRKLLVADQPRPDGRGRELAGVVMSANPHDGSSEHSNVALLLKGAACLDLIDAEQAVLDFSGSSIRLRDGLPPGYLASAAPPSPAPATLQLATEGGISRSLARELASATQGDSILVGMFYLSDRSVIRALRAAAGRGAEVRLILDPNRDAFGYKKNGIPNRPVAHELTHGGKGPIQVRWYASHGEQFHSKLVLIRRGAYATLFLGSANLTRRNLGDYNLEADLILRGPSTLKPIAEAEALLERLWRNDGQQSTLPYAELADPSPVRRWIGRFQEWSGLGTF